MERTGIKRKSIRARSFRSSAVLGLRESLTAFSWNCGSYVLLFPGISFSLLLSSCDGLDLSSKWLH